MRAKWCWCLLVGALTPVWAAKIPQCPLAGPEYLAPRSPMSSAAVKKALANIERDLGIAIRNGTSDYGAIDASATSFSMGVYSLYEEQPLFTFNHNGPKLPKPQIGVSKVDSNTIYRLGSISKLLTVFLYLATVGDTSYNDPITKYIPEFAEYAARHKDCKDNLDIWDFESMTVGAVASQLSGLPRGTIGNFYIDPELNALPLPNLPHISPNITGANCPNSYNTPCTRATFLQNIMMQKPTGPAFHRPAYSNVAFGILGLVLEKITGEALPDLFKKNLVEALKMNATYYAAPPTPKNGIIPYNNSISYWTDNIGNQSAAGNYYSSVNDMERLGRSILGSTLISPSLTGRFMSPASFLSRVRSAVGTPWELFDATKSLGKESWFYTKRGDIGTYSTTMALMPDWQAGFTVLTAGLEAGDINEPLSNVLATNLAPALEQAAKDEARAAYTGTFSDKKKNNTVIMEVDDGPGILLKKWTVEGTSMIEIFAELLGAKQGVLRLYPSGLSSGAHSEIIGYRVVAYSNSPETLGYPGEILSLACFEWTSIDAIAWGRHGLDEFAITTDPKTGKALTVEPRAFGVALHRA